jgi:ribonuclease P protein component
VLSQAHRLTSGDDFRRAVRHGRRSGGPLLVVHLWADPRATAPVRVGLVVSRAVGNAVTRNLVKRRLRHLARERVPALPGSTVLVLRALPAAATASYADLGAELDRNLGRVTR